MKVRTLRPSTDLPPSTAKFTTEDMNALMATFILASSENEVIPDIEGKKATLFQQSSDTYNSNIV
ncbi:6027_t:CDS:2 [Diversispora eburnea]|uniref:6027_t:CDS:1 n=1 Tax=Diversispora eburnea TaxID=1213867 RepID=A0A9N9GA64_9GLOM|nr:6027_t:CDS:2 [Diversispora eburnea]